MPHPSFNVAALRGARKSDFIDKLIAEWRALQCGRAPRSAEMQV